MTPESRHTRLYAKYLTPAPRGRSRRRSAGAGTPRRVPGSITAPAAPTSWSGGSLSRFTAGSPAVSVPSHGRPVARAIGPIGRSSRRCDGDLAGRLGRGHHRGDRRLGIRQTFHEVLPGLQLPSASNCRTTCWSWLAWSVEARYSSTPIRKSVTAGSARYVSAITSTFAGRREGGVHPQKLTSCSQRRPSESQFNKIRRCRDVSRSSHASSIDPVTMNLVPPSA